MLLSCCLGLGFHGRVIVAGGGGGRSASVLLTVGVWASRSSGGVSVRVVAMWISVVMAVVGVWAGGLAGSAVASSPAFVPVTGSPFVDRQRPGVGGVQSRGWAARDRQHQRQHGVGVLGRPRWGAEPGDRLAVFFRQRTVVGGVQSGGWAARDRQPARRHGVGVLGRPPGRADPGGRLAVCDRQRSVLGGVQSGGGLLATANSPTARCRCSRSVTAAR